MAFVLLSAPHTPVHWTKKRDKVLGNLSTFLSLLAKCLEVCLQGGEAPAEAPGSALVAILSVLFASLALANTLKAALSSLVRPVGLLFKLAASEPPAFSQQLLGKVSGRDFCCRHCNLYFDHVTDFRLFPTQLEKLVADVLGCLQSCPALAFDSELLLLLSPLLCVLFPHKNKHFRTPVTQFWNSTFANAVSLTYPDELR